jgi:hypothetical protein
VNLCRLYQSYMHVRAEHGQAVQLPVQLLTAASAAALAQETSRQSTTRAFHSQVARELEAACPEEAVEVGQQVGPGGRSREAALKGWEEGWLQVNLAVPSLRCVHSHRGRCGQRCVLQQDCHCHAGWWCKLTVVTSTFTTILKCPCPPRWLATACCVPGAGT